MFDGDWEPPVLTAVEARDRDRVALVFDEEVRLTEIRFEPERVVDRAEWRDEALEILVTDPLAPGQLCWIDACVEDISGNVSSVLVSVYGMNPDLPPVLINEVVCEGSGSHPDWVELLVGADGNLGGLTLYEGSPGIWDSRYEFPALEVAAGEFLVVHFKPERIVDEVDELGAPGSDTGPAASGGLDATPTARDVWVEGGDGIPNTTGALTLTAFPGGPVVDAFLYTTKTYDAADPLRGFGLQSQVDIMDELAAAGVWNTAGDTVVPEDLFDPEDSTATRSINRTPGGEDTDTAADWHIGPTSSASPGRANTSDVHVP